MPLRLIRKPRSANVVKPIIKEEVRAAWKELADKTIKELDGFVADWADKPVFKAAISLGEKEWIFNIKYDAKTTGGMHFKFVDKGTAERGGHGSPYVITAKNVKYLHYYTPDFPKTSPAEGGRPSTGQSTDGDRSEVFRVSVIHPGITPRRFTDSLRDELKPPGAGSFKNITDAAIKRGMRKIGKVR